jgi:DNA-directed RNA polymerase specialized sigma24 family protein
MERTDAEVLIASRDDPRAFRELYDRWADKLLACFYRRTLEPEVAADLLAETFAVAVARRRRQGCAIVTDVRAAPDGRGIVVVIEG